MKARTRYDSKGEHDYKQELEMARGDLFWVFGIEPAELNKMSKNNIYMMHQSKMVNAVYMMINKGYNGGE